VILSGLSFARISHGKRVRVPESVLEGLRLGVGDLVLFEIREGRVWMHPAEVKIRESEARTG